MLFPATWGRRSKEETKSQHQEEVTQEVVVGRWWVPIASVHRLHKLFSVKHLHDPAGLDKVGSAAVECQKKEAKRGGPTFVK